MVGISLVTIIAGIFALFLMVLVALSSSRIMLRVSFGIFAGALSVWAIGVGWFVNTADPVLASILVHTYYAAAAILIYGLTLFSYTFTRLNRTDGRRFVRVALMMLVPVVLLIAGILWPGFMISAIDLTGAYNTVVLNTTGYVVYAAIFLVYSLITLFLLFDPGRHGTRRIERQRQFIAWTIGLTLPAGAFFNLYLPLVGNYQLITIGPIFIFAVAGAFLYAITRRDLFDVKLALVRTLTYALVLGVLTSLYAFVVYVAFERMFGEQVSTLYTLTGAILALFLALVFRPIKQFFDKITHRLFYRDELDVDSFFAHINRQIAATTDIHTLFSHTGNEIAQALSAEQIIFATSESNGHVVGGTRSHHSLPLRDLRMLESYSVMAPRRAMLVRSLDDNEAVRRMLISHGIDIVLPLYLSAELVGFLLVGPHKSSHYARKDIMALETISSALAIAMRNARNVQEIRDLNASLQQRIDAATKELRTNNNQLQRLDKAKDEFVSMASHQLRTPLTSIKGYISMVLEGDVGRVSKQQRAYLEEAFNSSERMVHLIGDFLNVSRLQTGKFVIDRSRVSLAKVVGQEIDSLRTSAASRGMSFVYKAPKNIPDLMIDEDKIRQVIMNFADNAIYYSKDGGKIMINLKKVGDSVEYTVVDKGIGVPAAEQSQLFNKFFRASNARKQRPDGTGVGIFLARKVVRDHGGDIIFSSKEGVGSTFGFSLPIEKLRAANDANQLDNQPGQA